MSPLDKMTSIRQRIRTDNWTLIKVTFEERAKHDVTHRGLHKWAEEHCMGGFENTMTKNSNFNPVSVFVFENPADASMFILRWK